MAGCFHENDMHANVHGNGPVTKTEGLTGVPREQWEFKMRNSTPVWVVALMLTATAAQAADQTPPAPAPQNTPASQNNDDNQMVCHRETLTGSLLPGPRICKSAKVWREQRERSKDYINDQTTRNLQMNPKGG